MTNICQKNKRVRGGKKHTTLLQKNKRVHGGKKHTTLLQKNEELVFPVWIRTSALYESVFNEHEDASDKDDWLKIVPEQCRYYRDTIVTHADLYSMVLTYLYWGFTSTPDCIYDFYLDVDTKTPCNKKHIERLYSIPDLEKSQLKIELDIIHRFNERKSIGTCVVSCGNERLLQKLVERGYITKRYFHNDYFYAYPIRSYNSDLFNAALIKDANWVLPYFKLDTWKTQDQRNVMCLAASGGHIRCMTYFHEHKFSWDDHTMNVAAEAGRLSCVQYLCKHWGGTKTSYPVRIAVRKGHLSCVKYLHENGYPWYDPFSSRTDIWGSVDADEMLDEELIRYIHENGCPYTDHLEPVLHASILKILSAV